MVSQKVSKKATIRNKVRRRLVEIIKKEEKGLSMADKDGKGKDLVIVALAGIEKKEFSEIKENLELSLKKIKISLR